MAILLAPMEGLLDFTLRDLLTRAGGIDRCVSEFIRVSGTLLPDSVFRRLVPELDSGSRTPAGVPVRPQLLGSDPVCLAENAARLAALQPEGIDLNFGCPAKVVNRHGGGAALLDEPEQLMAIVAAVRRAVPAQLPVSAKMRLGTQDGGRARECAQAIEAGGARELVVHARTRADGYRPPARWEQVAAVREAVGIPVVANGEIWTVEDARRCRELSGCADLMLGRGLVSDPGLARTLAGLAMGRAAPAMDWPTTVALLQAYWLQIAVHVGPRHRAGRLKQWLGYLRRSQPQAVVLFDRIRCINDAGQVGALLAQAATCAERAPDNRAP